MTAPGLVLPPADLHLIGLPLIDLHISHLVRVHWPGGQLRMSRDASCRFDQAGNKDTDPAAVPGTCYFGTTIALSFAESILHELIPVLKKTSTGWKSYVLSFARDIAVRKASTYRARDPGQPLLRLANLVGPGLHRIGCTSSITSTLRDDIPDLYCYSQAWANAILRHPDKVDGIRFIPSHMNQLGCAVALFEHALPKLEVDQQCALPLATSSDPGNDFERLTALFSLGFIETAEEINDILLSL